MKDETTLHICILACNEAERIGRCLSSVANSFPSGMKGHVTVVANGCRDATAAVAGRFTHERLTVTAVELTVGDKSNAWNHFTHDLAPRGVRVLFLDGDVWLSEQCLGDVLAAASTHPEAYLFAAAPGSGRNGDTYRREQVENRSLWGACYLATAAFLEAMRGRSIRLPTGYIGDDGLLETIAKTDLLTVPWVLREEAVCVVPSARFHFDTMRLADWRSYLRRKTRYSMRMMQRQLLYPHLRVKGIEGLPGDIRMVYDSAVASLRPRSGPDWPFDRKAIRLIKEAGVRQ